MTKSRTLVSCYLEKSIFIAIASYLCFAEDPFLLTIAACILVLMAGRLTR